ncbi:MAG: transglycosylase SLT domain-containing protein [Alphaproteobacteria bacterium]|nr:transglycosylase SLT domain-containing protein [Alphaproteobacteria bacterium]
MGLCLMVAACAGTGRSPTDSAADYAWRAQTNYTPPGPSHDPWGPYIAEASARFDVPEQWIREVVRQESGGRTHMNGRPITSSAGAMGLMQLMPGTWAELRAMHSLGDDPYHPRDNILAGTAYIREMYERYGSPAFLAAYNAGPRRLEEYLGGSRGLPDETRNYVARIAPAIRGHAPQNRAAAEVYAAGWIPDQVPRGPRRVGYASVRPPMPPRAVAASRPVQIAAVPAANAVPSYGRSVQVAALPAPPVAPRPAYQMAEARAAAPPAVAASRGSGWSLIPPAHAATLPRLPPGPPAATRAVAPAPGPWAIQVGAFANEMQARSMVGTARGLASDLLRPARPAVVGALTPRGSVYRARFMNLSRDAAEAACARLAASQIACIALSPDRQS